MMVTQKIRTYYATLAITVGLATAGPVAAEPVRISPTDPTVRAVVRDLCYRRIVLLGEADHGDGTTIAFKAEVTRQLIKRCGFDTVLAEASHYDFIAIQDKVDRGQRVSMSELEGAFGGLWNRSQEFATLATFILNRQRHGLRVGGLDDQLGNRDGYYGVKGMADDLAALLPPNRRSLCTSTLRQRIRWDYSPSNPYDVKQQGKVRACLASEPNVGTTSTSLRNPIIRHLRDTVSKSIDRESANRDSAIAGRDRAMADLFDWFMARARPSSRIIVWASTAHVAKDVTSLGRNSSSFGKLLHERYKEQTFSLGFSASRGSTRSSSVASSESISESSSSSIERQLVNVLTKSKYCNIRCLSKMGDRAGGFFFHDPITTDWSNVLDGAVIFYEEKASSQIG